MMKSNQRRVKIDFLSSLDTALRIFYPAREWCEYRYEAFTENPYQPKVAERIIGLSFLNALSAWEEFLENTFLGYLSGYCSENNYSPILRIKGVKNRSHALQLISGQSNLKNIEGKVRWHDMDWVINLASIYFQKGKPYSDIPEWIIQKIVYAQAVRNRIAHSSPKARRQFKKAANNLHNILSTNPLPKGYTPGTLLIEPIENCFPVDFCKKYTTHWGDVFEGYVAMFSELSEMVLPSNTEYSFYSFKFGRD